MTTQDWVFIPDAYPPDLGGGIGSAPVLCWVSDFWCPYAVLRHWQSKEAGQPHKWFIDNTFYNMGGRYPSNYPEFPFEGVVLAWMSLPEKPQVQEAML